MLRNVPLFGIGNKALSVTVSEQERTNLYVEVQEDPEANGLVLVEMADGVTEDELQNKTGVPFHRAS